MGITHFSAVDAGSSLEADAFSLNGTTFYPVIVDVTAVDASGGGTAQTTTCTVVPAGSIILNVIGVVTATFNGDATTTIEVGVNGNTDKYIDPSDLDPAGTNQLDIFAGTNQDQKGMEYCAAATTLLCTWTNTASASAGAASIYVVYADVS